MRVSLLLLVQLFDIVLGLITEYVLWPFLISLKDLLSHVLYVEINGNNLFSSCSVYGLANLWFTK